MSESLRVIRVQVYITFSLVLHIIKSKNMISFYLLKAY